MMKVVSQLVFWKHFGKFFLLLLSLFILSAGLLLANKTELLKRGPGSVFAEDIVSVEPQEGEESVSVVPQEGSETPIPNVSVSVVPQSGSVSSPYILQEIRECSGSSVVINRYWSDGRKETVSNQGMSPGECGVPFNTGSSSLNSVPSTPVSVGSSGLQAYVLQELRECDGNEVIINRYWSDGRKETIARSGLVQGECGVPFNTGSSSLNTVPATPVSGGGGGASQPYILQELRECDGNTVVINRYWSDGRKETVSRVGQTQGECGVPFNTGSNSLSNVPATPVNVGGGSPAQPYVLQELRECDGNTVVINRYWSDGRKETVARVGRNQGECGVPFNTGSNTLSNVPATPVNVGLGSTPQPYVLQELRECDGNTVVINRYWSDGRKETVARVGQNQGECGVPFQSGSASLSNVPAAPVNTGAVSPQQPYVLQELRECEGSIVVLNRYWNNGRKETIVRYGQNPGECGVPIQVGSTQLSSVPASVASVSSFSAPQPYILQEMRECEGNSVVINRYWNNGRRDTVARLGQSPGECGLPINNIIQTSSINSVPSPSVTLSVASAPQPYLLQELRECEGNNVVINQYWSNGSRTTSANLGQNPGECGVNRNLVTGGGQTGVGNVAGGSVTTNPLNVGAAAGGGTTGNQVVCPSGYTYQVQGNTAYCLANAGTGSTTSSSSSLSQSGGGSVAGTNQVAQPKVINQVTSDAQELPKTGLPLAAWGVSGLLPLGLKLKNRKKGSAVALQADNGESSTAQTIWLERQLKV